MAAEIAPADHRAQKIQYQCCKRYPKSPQLYTETVIFEQKAFQQCAAGIPYDACSDAPCLRSRPMSTASRLPDPQPQPPVKPGNDECCRSGCTFCVLEMYQEDLAAYEAALRAWQQRQQASATPASKRAGPPRKAP